MTVASHGQQSQAVRVVVRAIAALFAHSLAKGAYNDRNGVIIGGAAHAAVHRRGRADFLV